MIPGIHQETLFTRQTNLKPSLFIRPIHPKTEIRPTAEAMSKILKAGWVAQLKIHGHRAQIHIPPNPNEDLLAYNRQGQLHKKSIPDLLASEIRRIFAGNQHWNVIDAEWTKSDDKLYVFDLLKQEGLLLSRLNFTQRWKMLPRAFISPSIQKLPILTTLGQCLEALKDPRDFIEGLVFKSPSPGFEDSSIIRCRRR